MADTLPDDPMDDTPAEPGSRFNPVLLSDSPPKRKAKRRSILESRSRSAVMGESDALPTDVAMDDATPTAPGSRFNPYLLPDSPPKRKAKRILASRDTMAAVSTRIGELEAAIPIPVLNTTNLPSTSRASTSRASTSRASTSQASTSRASPSQSRPRHAILALEASLRENRTARTVAETRSAARLRTMGPATDIPRGDQDVRLDAARTLDAAHAGRREEAYLTRGVGMMIAVGSWRPQRATKLRPEDLWKNGVGPAEQDAIEDHHRCSICLSAKSHPVSYTCGHSHCYACIRVWLEYEWTCPDCVAKMYLPPFRHYAEEAALALAYPQWQDRSEVDYSFDRLIFPKQRRNAYPAVAPFPDID